MEKCCKKCNKIFDDGEKFCPQCGQKLVKLDLKDEKEKIVAYYQKMFAGTNTEFITARNNVLLVRLKDTLETYNKVFAKICDREKCDLLEYNISIESFQGPKLKLHITPKKNYSYTSIYDVRIYGFITPKNIERFKKYKDEEAIQREVKYVQHELEWIGEALDTYKEEQKMWAKSLKLLEKVKEVK